VLHMCNVYTVVGKRLNEDHDLFVRGPRIRIYVSLAYKQAHLRLLVHE
jgi:hypothetical protein